MFGPETTLGPDQGFKFSPRKALGTDLGFKFDPRIPRTALGADARVKFGPETTLGPDQGFKFSPRKALGPDLVFKVWAKNSSARIRPKSCSWPKLRKRDPGQELFSG